MQMHGFHAISGHSAIAEYNLINSPWTVCVFDPPYCVLDMALEAQGISVRQKYFSQSIF